jgi:hypothetical protein
VQIAHQEFRLLGDADLGHRVDGEGYTECGENVRAGDLERLDARVGVEGCART